MKPSHRSVNNINKNISFNFDDKNSLKKLKNSYDEFLRSINQKSQIYGQNVGGSNSQLKYLQQELDVLKKISEARKGIYNDKSAKFEDLSEREAGLRHSFKQGNITSGFLQSQLDKIQNDRRGLLSGTGFRKEHTYLKGEGEVIKNQNQILQNIEKTLEESQSLTRAILSNDKETAQREIEEIRKNPESSTAQILAADQAQLALDKRQGAGSQTKERSLLREFLQASNIHSLMNNAAGVLTSNSSVDALRKASNTAIEMGISLGDAVGGGVEAFADRWIGKVGARLLGNAISGGVRVAGTAASVSAETLYEAYEAREAYNAQRYGIRALTGRLFDPYSMTQYGYSATESQELAQVLAKASGTNSGLSGITRSAQLLDRGFGVENSSITQLLELTRSAAETDKNIENILGGMWKEGQQIFRGDRTFLNEFIVKNYNPLYRQLQQNQTSVSSGSVMRALTQFNSIGGQFGARHPNSVGLISSINESLMNPNGDTMDALTFTALRQQMPGSSMLDILKERQKGLSSPQYLKAVLGQIEMMGGGGDFQAIQVANALGLNYEAAESLVKNRGKIGSMSTSALTGYIGDLTGQAGANTTQTQIHAAELQDAKIMGAFDKISTLIDQMGEVWRSTWDGATYTLDPATGKITATGKMSGNISKTPTGPVKQQISPSSWWENASSHFK